MIYIDSTLKEVWENPVGHDIIKKLLITKDIPEKTLINPLTLRLKLSQLTKVFGNKVDPNFLMAMIHLVNLNTDKPSKTALPRKKAWWKEAVFYQIYPRSFKDTNGDGIGDLPGIIEKLDYLKELGVDALWLSPIYDSPNDDNGYDIRDYRAIMKEFGTMEDFDRLLKAAQDRGLKIIMDLVVNHTSDEHEWFQKAISDPKSKYRNYYFLQEEDGLEEPPNNWKSWFSGPAWDRYGKDDLWGLHLFSKKQPDLNWDNPELREDIYDMVRWWLEKGVDGFRMDVISFISKEEGLPDGDETVGETLGFTGIERYFYGPHMHEYFREIREKAFAPYDAFSVGETPMIGMEMAKFIAGEDRKELDMVFSFDHMDNPGRSKFEDYEYDLNIYRDYITDWMENYGPNCWMSLFYNNHDNPRMCGKITMDPALRQRVQTLLAVMQMTLKGTPFIYQGDEMGLTNYDFHSMEEIRDIESKNLYEEMINGGESPEEAFALIKAGTRDHSRELLPWNDFSEDHPAHLTQEQDPAIYNVYHDLIALRKKYPTLIYGEFKLMNRDHNHFTYARKDKNGLFVIDCNLSGHRLPSVFRREGFALEFAPAFLENGAEWLSPYEARIFRKE